MTKLHSVDPLLFRDLRDLVILIHQLWVDLGFEMIGVMVPSLVDCNVFGSQVGVLSIFSLSVYADKSNPSVCVLPSLVRKEHGVPVLGVKQMSGLSPTYILQSLWTLLEKWLSCPQQLQSGFQSVMMNAP